MSLGVERVRAVTFDADQTLWDFRAVQHRALRSTGELLAERHGVTGVGVEDLQALRDEVAAEVQGSVHDLAAIRLESFVRALERAGHPSPHEAAAGLVEHYMAIRFDAIELYDDVRAGLAEVKRHLPIGLLSNGNTDPDRCGLPGVFDAVIMGPEHGVAKPEAAAFELIAERLGVRASELMHVGDGPTDIDGANAIGAVSVLIERDGPRPELAALADLRISSLDELPALLRLA